MQGMYISIHAADVFLQQRSGYSKEINNLYRLVGKPIQEVRSSFFGTYRWDSRNRNLDGTCD